MILKEANFAMIAFNGDGLEIHKHQSRPAFVHACLLEANYEAYHIQVLPQHFLYVLTNSDNTVKRETAKFMEPSKMPWSDALVNVHYIFPPNQKRGVAVGFKGKKWTAFCFEHNIEAGYHLLFTHEGSNDYHDFNYIVKLFNNEGIAIHPEPAHRCSHYKHRHSNRSPLSKEVRVSHHQHQHADVHHGIFWRVFSVSSLKKGARDDFRKLASAIYLQVSTISQALIFVTRSRSWSYKERPGAPLFGAFLGAQLVDRSGSYFSGSYFSRKASAVGKNMSNANTFLEKQIRRTSLGLVLFLKWHLKKAKTQRLE